MQAPRPNGLWLHFRKFLTSPRLLASLVPSSRNLARLVAANTILPPGTFAVEIGAGTGIITRGLLDAGIAADRIIAVEIDPELAGYLRAALPDITVLECDVFDLPAHLPEAARNRIGAVICGIPGSLLPPDAQQRLVDLMFSLLPADTPFLAYSHRFGAPLPEAALGISGTRLARTVLNFPMASVWSFRRSRAGAKPAPSATAGVV